MLNDKKIILITGGDKGLGLGMIQVLAKKDAYIISTYKSNINGVIEIQKIYQNVKFIQCDFNCIESIKTCILKIRELTNHIDILINNVGIMDDKIIQKLSFQQWSNVINVNFVNVFYFIKQFSSDMIKRKWGRIINISSIAAVIGAYGKTNYSSSKSALIGLTKSLAIELASKNITVNVICPGAFDTDMFNKIPQKYREKIKNDIPLKRLGYPKEIGYLVEFLIDDKAEYITGQTIHINGGSYFG